MADRGGLWHLLHSRNSGRLRINFLMLQLRNYNLKLNFEDYNYKGVGLLIRLSFL
jgi:hypothetical protein